MLAGCGCGTWSDCRAATFRVAAKDVDAGQDQVVDRIVIKQWCGLRSRALAVLDLGEGGGSR